jgi:hypothetical protein
MERKYYAQRAARRRSAPGGRLSLFVCLHCGATVSGEAAGTRQRNHCPRCLYSLHVDVTVGDRRSLCGGLMQPIGLWVRGSGELALLHRCERCYVIRANRLAGDDDEEALRALAEPLSRLFRAPAAL